MNRAPVLLFIFSILINNGSQQILQRRQSVSYSSSVIHQDPKYPDQTAESSVKVILNPSESNQQNTKLPAPPSYGNLRLKQQTTPNKPSSINHNDQSQSFNVGYSVSFMNGIPTNNPQASHHHNQFITRQKNLDGGEIITGTRKRNEEVQVPHFDSTHSFASNALFDNNQQKIADLKNKNQFFGESMNFPNTNFLLNQLSPTTQKNFKLLEQINPNNNQLDQNLALQQYYSWRNLSPSVEIIRSTEIPINQKLIEQQSSKFNHEKALGHSQGFDYSNAMEPSLSSSSSSNPHQSNSFFNHFNNLKNSPLTPQNLIPTNNGGLKFPIDTRLLREPILTSDIKSVMSDSSVIPIHYDTRLLKEVMKNQLAPYQVQKITQHPQDNYIEPHPTQQPASSSQYRVVHEPYSQQLTETNQPQNSNTGFQDYQGPKNKYQYKIYGKPQPVRSLSGFNGASGFSTSPQGYDFNQQRQPRFSVGDYNLQTNLTPPPFAKYHFQRRMYIGF